VVKKALVVDNHPVILTFMSRLLEKRGYEVVAAHDGLSALEVLKAFTPEVVFVDLVMPNIGGDKLCRMMRRSRALSDAYIVVLSAIAAEGHFDHAAFGADTCIAKGPLQTMSAHIQEVLDQYEKTGRPSPRKDVIGVDGLRERTIIKELLLLNSHFEMVLDHLSEGILELTAGEKIVYANPIASVMIGADEEELLGTSLSDHLSDSQGEKLRMILQGCTERFEPGSLDSPIVLDERLVIPDVVPLQKEKGDSVIVILKDVTRQKLMEAKLLEAQKMQAIATLAGGVAHQFNNALAVIVGNVEFMKMASHGNNDVGRYLEPIVDAVRKIARLNDHLLAYARGGKYHPKVVAIQDFIKETLPLIRHTMGPDVQLESIFQDVDAHVDMDTSQMQMVLSAVLSNASEALESQGKIRFECKKLEVLPDRRGPGASPLGPHDYVCIIIEDNGRGMDEETRARIFEPFFTTKLHGRGMGMAAVYGIVKNHGGLISVDSQAGKGTKVSIFLPVVKPRGAQNEKEEVKKKKPAGTLLLIDDEPMVLEVNRAIIEGLGYNVLASNTGNHALDIAASHEGPIDLAILDIVLPDIEARELYGRLMEARPDLKVIVCSGYSVDGPAQEILDKGAKGFLQKPFTLKKLSDTLKRAVESPV
jgi:two-component system, cell cycle sensor histidine kinase and response regulator CckA